MLAFSSQPQFYWKPIFPKKELNRHFSHRLITEDYNTKYFITNDDHLFSYLKIISKTFNTELKTTHAYTDTNCGYF
jgi:hypothetical protein